MIKLNKVHNLDFFDDTGNLDVKKEERDKTENQKPESAEIEEKDYWQKLKEKDLSLEEKKLLEKLEQDKIIFYQDGKIVFDYDKYKTINFRKNYYLGRKDNKQIFGSKKMLKQIMSGVKFVLKSDFNKRLVDFSMLEEEELEWHNRKVKEKFINKLKELKVLEEKDNLLVCDLDKIRHLDLGKMISGSFKQQRIYRSRTGVFMLLSGLKVVSKEDYERAKKDKNFSIKPKPLFNVPESVDQAFDVNNIKDKDYYLNYWDINKEKPMQYYTEIIARDGERIKVNELYLATKIYRDFQGKRIQTDIGDRLVIFDRAENKYKKISWEWLQKNNILGTKWQKYGGIHKYLVEQCPNLLKKGLLKLSDFEILTASKGGQLLRKEFLFETSNHPKIVSIDSVQYYIGRRKFNFGGESIPIENIKVVVLDNKTAGIVEMHEGREVLKYTIDLLSKEEKEQKRKEVERRHQDKKLSYSQISALMFLNKKEVEKRMDKFSLTSLIQKKKGETEEEYEERKSHIADFGYIKRITDKFVQDCGLGIHNLSWREQVWLAAAVYELGIKNEYDRLVTFAKRYKEKGLKTFLSCEDNINNARKILLLGEKLKDHPEIANLLFKRYADIVERTDNLREQIKLVLKDKEVSKEEIRQIGGNVLQMANQALLNFYEELKDLKTEEIETEEIIKELENYQADLILTVSVWKAIDKSNIRLEDLEGVSFEKITVSELTRNGRALEIVERVLAEKEKFPVLAASSFKGETDKIFSEYDEMDRQRAKEILQMFKVYYDNYKAKPDLQKKLLENFREKLKSGGENIVIYLYKKANKDGREDIIAFNRFDIVSKDKRYFGSFNVPSALAGSAVGSALLKASLEEQAQEAAEIEADCEPEKGISSVYIEKYGFVVRKIIPDYAETGITAFNIVRRKENEKYYYRDYDWEDIIKEYERNFSDNRYREGDKFIILKFSSADGTPLDKEEKLQNMLKETAPLVNERGYVMTRYFFTNKQKEVYCVLEKEK